MCEETTEDFQHVGFVEYAVTDRSEQVYADEQILEQGRVYGPVRLNSVATKKPVRVGLESLRILAHIECRDYSQLPASEEGARNRANSVVVRERGPVSLASQRMRYHAAGKIKT